MVDSNRIINYLKPRIKDIIYYSKSFVYYKKPVFMLYINNDWVHHHQYIYDRFGLNYDAAVDEYINMLYEEKEHRKRITRVIIEYLKSRITDIIQHNKIVSSDMTSSTLDDIIHLNLRFDRIYHIIVDDSEYNFYEYVNDRFGMDYNKEELDHFITSLYYQKNDIPIIDYTYTYNQP